ncbi:unnamed protein product [Caenorhabditis nigoni]
MKIYVLSVFLYTAPISPSPSPSLLAAPFLLLVKLLLLRMTWLHSLAPPILGIGSWLPSLLMSDSQAKLPVKQRRKSTHVDSTSQLPNKEPPQKPKAKKDQPEKNIEKTGKADKEKEKNQADDLINEGPDVLTEPPMIIKREPSVPSNSLKTEPVATVESKPFRIETPPPTSVPLEDAEKIDSKELLNSLRNLVYTLDSRFLEKLQKNARTTFNYSLLIANRISPDEVTTNISKSLKLFFSLLRNSLFFLNTKALDSIHTKLKENIEQLEKHDKIITIQYKNSGQYLYAGLKLIHNVKLR